MLHNATPCYNSPRVTTKHTTTHKTVYPNRTKIKCNYLEMYFANCDDHS